jgi:hypothetical protein
MIVRLRARCFSRDAAEIKVSSTGSFKAAFAELAPTFGKIERAQGNGDLGGHRRNHPAARRRRDGTS